MELGLALEIWAASLAVAGAIGWIIGDRRGAASLADIVRDDEAEAMREGLFTLTIPPLHPPGCERSGSLANSPDRRMSATRHAAKPASLPTPAPRTTSRERAEIFASMPPIAELEQQVRAIRLVDEVWTSPDMGEHLADFLGRADLGSLEVLSHYRKAVYDLRRESEMLQVGECFYDGSQDTPLLAAAAPLDAQAYLEGMKRDRNRHTRWPLAANG